jgi:hypothetical protein
VGGKKLFAQSSTELILYSGKKFAIKSIIKHENEVHKKYCFCLGYYKQYVLEKMDNVVCFKINLTRFSVFFLSVGQFSGSKR